MADKSTTNENEVSRERLAELLNEDLAREYQAIIGYVVYFPGQVPVARFASCERATNSSEPNAGGCWARP